VLLLDRLGIGESRDRRCHARDAHASAARKGQTLDRPIEEDAGLRGSAEWSSADPFLGMSDARTNGVRRLATPAAEIGRSGPRDRDHEIEAVEQGT
jgi:hypothetical protein